MLYRGSIGPFGVFERIRDVDPVFINHIKELFQNRFAKGRIREGE